MSFFLVNEPANITSEFVRPAEQVITESGAINQRYSGVAYWKGSIDFVPQEEGSTLWGELERAVGDDAFFADLYADSKAPAVTAVWETVQTAPAGYDNSATLFTTNINANTTPYGSGSFVSFRRVVPGNATQQAEGRKFVTARLATGRSTIGGKYVYTLETPLTQEFVAEAGAVIEICFNRPHVRARLLPDALKWSATQPIFTNPTTVEWFEDVGGNMNFLFSTLNSPTGGVAPPLEDYLMNEAGSDFLVTEDGKYLITED